MKAAFFFGLMSLLISTNALASVECSGVVRNLPTRDGRARPTNDYPLHFDRPGERITFSRAGRLKLEFVEFAGGSKRFNVFAGEDLLFSADGPSFDGSVALDNDQFASVNCR